MSQIENLKLHNLIQRLNILKLKQEANPLSDKESVEYVNKGIDLCIYTIQLQSSTNPDPTIDSIREAAERTKALISQDSWGNTHAKASVLKGFDLAIDEIKKKGES